MGRSRPKIPFLMFQDVIMAVFGILILIVIYLLINAKVSDIEYIEDLDEMRSEKASLGDSVKKAAAERDILYENTVKVIESRETLELAKQVEVNRILIEKFDDQIGNLLTEVEINSENLNKTILERFERHPAVLSTQRALVEERAELEAPEGSIAIAELEAETTEVVIENTEIYMDEIKDQFRVELDKSLAGESVYLVDFSSRAFRAFKVHNGEQSPVECSSASELLKKVKTDKKKKRVFFFVRPHAVTEFKKKLPDFRQSRIAVGYQPLPEGEDLILTKFPDGVPAADVPILVTSGVVAGEQAGSGGVTAGDPEADSPDVAIGGVSGSEVAGESQVSPLDSASDSSAGVDATSGAGPEQPSGADSNKESATDSGQASEETTSGNTTSANVQAFKWLLLIFLIIFLIILIRNIKGSKA